MEVCLLQVILVYNIITFLSVSKFSKKCFNAGVCLAVLYNFLVRR